MKFQKNQKKQNLADYGRPLAENPSKFTKVQKTLGNSKKTKKTKKTKIWQTMAGPWLKIVANSQKSKKP